MEALLAQCGHIVITQYSLWISVLLAGLVGSLTHCSIMCAPLVAAQMLELKESKTNIKLIAWYHAGRITTYMFLGLIAFSMNQWLFSWTLFEISHILLGLAGLVFIFSAISPRKSHKCYHNKQFKILGKIGNYFKVETNFFIRGLMMGLMPCGMLFSVLLLTIASPSVFMAMTLMLIFGLSTLPVLQSFGLMALSLNKHYPKFGENMGRTIMATNGFMLCFMSLGLINIH